MVLWRAEVLKFITLVPGSEVPKFTFALSSRSVSYFKSAMVPDAIEVRLKPKERAVLESRLRAATTEQRQLLRITDRAGGSRRIWDARDCP